MFDEPADLTCDRIRVALAEHWGLAAWGVRYAPLGFGSHHWIVERSDGEPAWFVTADRLADGNAFETLNATAAATFELAEQGLEFVLAGLADRAGRLVVPLDGSWAMQVYPYVIGQASGFGRWEDPGERHQIATLLRRLHDAIPPPSLPRWDSAIPQRDALTAAFDDLGRPWSTGPYADAVRGLLAERRAAVERRLARYDALVNSVESTSALWVVSHGEPHAGNVIRTDGAMLLIDWDTVRRVPKERDLVNAFDDGTTDLQNTDAIEAYQHTAGRVTLHEESVQLFRLWWGLAEICAYAAHFRGPQRDGEDVRLSWRAVLQYLPAGYSVSAVPRSPMSHRIRPAAKTT